MVNCLSKVISPSQENLSASQWKVKSGAGQKEDQTFPSHTTFSRFGGKQKLIAAISLFCKTHKGNEDIIALCKQYEESKQLTAPEHPSSLRVPTGFVYLMKSGRRYKIGHTNSVGARERQLAIQIPIPPRTIHRIETDDPTGVETCWHKRFAAKRGKGEWFDLSPEDVEAFKRWRKIV